jgi:ADP-ribose pyrophosphatase YjhB (NUDIX family)
MPPSTDGAAAVFPVSVKGVLFRDDRVVLVFNSRGERELPGGKLERDETPEGCVARELAEELGVAVLVDGILDAWVYRIAARGDVLIVTYACRATAWPATLASPEGSAIGLFALAELDGLPLPDGYGASIRRAAMRGWRPA